MKKLIYLFVTIALVAGVASCKKSKEDKADKLLTEAVNSLTVPQELNDGTTLTECSYADKTLTFKCEVDSKIFKQMDQAKSESGTLEELNTGLFSRNLVRAVKSANASIRYVFYNGSDSLTFTLSPDQLETAY